LVGTFEFWGSQKTDRRITNYFREKLNMTGHRFYFPAQEDARNVGTFAMCFAYYRLEADQIFLIGFDNEGTDYVPYIFAQWEHDFWLFVTKWIPHTVINCTKAGILYDKETYVVAGDLAWIRPSYRRRTKDVLVIGGGPTTKETIDRAKKFKGDICIVDSISRMAMDHKIPFDYIITLEKCTAATMMLLENGRVLQPIRDQFTLVFSPGQIHLGSLIAVYKKVCDHLLRFTAKYGEVANVGLYAIQFAEEYLHAKKIFLLGFDHHGTDVFGNPYEQWIFDKWMAEFSDYLDHGTGSKIINCSPNTEFKDKRISYSIPELIAK